jgi:uncharacterized protein HemY
MKPLLLIITLLFATLFFGFLFFSDIPPMVINWLDWDIKIDFFLLLILWLVSLLVFWMIIGILKTPKKIKHFLQKHKADKSTNQFNKAIVHYLKNEYDQVIENCSTITEEENYFEAQLMTACSYIHLNQLSNASNIIRILTRKYPQQAHLLQFLLAKWQFQLNEYHLAYETIANEIKENSPIPEKWFSLISATEYTGRLDEWQTLLPIAKKDLSRQDFKELKIKLHTIQINHTENSEHLKQVWNLIDSKARNELIIKKHYLDRCNKFGVKVDNLYAQIKELLKQNWNNNWLWDMANYNQLNEFHDLLDWCKKMTQQHNYPMDCSYYLSLSVIACRAKLWAISEGFLLQANKTFNKTEEEDIIIILVKNWITSQVEQKKTHKNLLNLMAKYGITWVHQD